jgi:septal ring factor EnvC (AmiA/AmiB activator)
MRSRSIRLLVLATIAGCGGAPGAHPIEPPVSAPVTLPFGPYVHPRLGLEVIHQGVSYECDPGAEVRAVAAGVVTFAGDASSYGPTVAIEGNGWGFVYAHLDDLRVSVGDHVSARDLIARSSFDCEARGGVYFGIWRDGVAVDPAGWSG